MSLNLNRAKMTNQSPKNRINNFDEVALGFDEETAKKEASRCLNCKNPKCRKGCPVFIDIPGFIKEIVHSNFEKSYEILKKYSLLPAVCGRVCPQENQCEGFCILNSKKAPINIGGLERFVADLFLNSDKKSIINKPKSTNKKVAILGGGPAGLACAYDLAKNGHEITIFEALNTLGGVLIYGIPEFRLPKKIVQNEIEKIKQLGVNIKVNSISGKINTIKKLLEEDCFDAIFIGTGAGLPYFLGIPGENYNQVYSANEFLTRVNLMKAYKFPKVDTPVIVGNKVAVIGAGNVAMDSARTAKRLGAKEVYIVYRRSKDEIPARKEELEHAEEEGIILKLLTSPKSIIGDESNENVKGLNCIKYKLGEIDLSGRRKPIVIDNSEFELLVDMVVIAIGQGPNPLLLESTKGLKLNQKGNIIVNENFETSLKGVFAGGDIVTGAATVILAMGAGKKAASKINDYLNKK